jgi:uncharacterized protein (TIGR02646 family)
MKWIEKNLKNEPKSLRLHRQKSVSNYDNYAEKDDLRRALLEEQGYLCCYCMSRIQTPTQDKMKIEHFQSQHEFPELQLNFNNLLASCKGSCRSFFDKSIGKRDIVTRTSVRGVFLSKILRGYVL